jgi:hypothetical protein
MLWQSGTEQDVDKSIEQSRLLPEIIEKIY